MDAASRRLIRLLQQADTPLTQADLQGLSRLSQPTVSKWLGRLEKYGMVKADSIKQGTVGRPQKLYQLKPRSCYTAGFYVGDQEVMTQIFDLDGRPARLNYEVLQPWTSPVPTDDWRTVTRVIEMHMADWQRSEATRNRLIAGGLFDTRKASVKADEAYRTGRASGLIADVLARSLTVPVIELTQGMAALFLALDRYPALVGRSCIVITLGRPVRIAFYLTGTRHTLANRLDSGSHTGEIPLETECPEWLMASHSPPKSSNAARLPQVAARICQAIVPDLVRLMGRSSPDIIITGPVQSRLTEEVASQLPAFFYKARSLATPSHPITVELPTTEPCHLAALAVRATLLLPR